MWLLLLTMMDSEFVNMSDVCCVYAQANNFNKFIHRFTVLCTAHTQFKAPWRIRQRTYMIIVCYQQLVWFSLRIVFAVVRLFSSCSDLQVVTTIAWCKKCDFHDLTRNLPCQINGYKRVSWTVSKPHTANAMRYDRNAVHAELLIVIVLDF